MIGNLGDLLIVTAGLSSYLRGEGVRFSPSGFPVLPRESFLEEWPDRFIDYQHRNGRLVEDGSKTVICFFSPDERIFPRIEKVLDELPEYRGYMAIAEPDLTLTKDMDVEYQSLLMLLNALFMGVQAVNGNKVVPNMRSGIRETVRLFSCIPSDVLWVSSSLGCESLLEASDTEYLEKAMYVRPSKLALYGKRDIIAEEQLSVMGINWRRYPDVHASYRALRAPS